MELIVKYGNCVQNTEKMDVLYRNVSKQVGGTGLGYITALAEYVWNLDKLSVAR